MITCAFEDGAKASLRHVTVNAIVVKNDEVLLGKRGTFQGKPILEAGKWGLLGGFLGRDETLIQAARREVMEESGWEIDDIKLFRINDNPQRPKEDRQNIDIIFIAKATKQVGISDEEVTELSWYGLNNLPPKDQIAFDHSDALEMYKKYLKGQLMIPVLG